MHGITSVSHEAHEERNILTLLQKLINPRPDEGGGGDTRGVTLYINGVARATASKTSATPIAFLPPHHLAPYIGRAWIMKAAGRAKESTHGQKVPAEARHGHKTGLVKQKA